MHRLFLCEFFGFFRIPIPPLPYIGIQKPQNTPPPEMQKVSTRIIRVDTFNSSRLFTEGVTG